MRSATALDSNLLLLLLVGSTSRSLINRVRRLRAYSESDFDLLLRLLEASGDLVLSPNTLTETSNLLHAGPSFSELGIVMQQARRLLEECGERYVRTVEACAHPAATPLGITDSVLLILAETGATSLTADLDLWVAAQRANYQAINFNHYRA